MTFNQYPAFVKTFFEPESMPTRPLRVRVCLENDNVWQTQSYNMLPLMLAKATSRGVSLQIDLPPYIRAKDYSTATKTNRGIVTAPPGGHDMDRERWVWHVMDRERWFDTQRRRRLLQDVKSGYISDV